MELENQSNEPTFEKPLAVADELNQSLRTSIHNGRQGKANVVGEQAGIVFHDLKSSKRFSSKIILDLSKAIARLAMLNSELNRAASHLRYVHNMCDADQSLEWIPQFAECLELLAELALAWNDPEISRHYLLRCQSVRERVLGHDDAATLRAK